MSQPHRKRATTTEKIAAGTHAQWILNPEGRSVRIPRFFSQKGAVELRLAVGINCCCASTNGWPRTPGPATDPQGAPVFRHWPLRIGRPLHPRL